MRALSVQQAPMTPSGVISLVLGLLGTLVFMIACRPAPPIPAGPILIFAVDGLEWSVIAPMIRDGELPVIARLMREGMFGKLETMQPTSSPVIWTTVATGKQPEKHGITDLMVRDPDGNAVRHTLRTDRRTKAIWNIFSDFGQTVHAIGWWKTYPVEAIHGVMIAQMNTLFSFQRGEAGRFNPRKAQLVRGIALPSRERDHVVDIAFAMERAYEQRAASLFGTAFTGAHEPLEAELWERARWVVTLDGIHLQSALDLEQERDSDLLLVYMRGFDVLAHGFWRYVEPDAYEHPPSPDAVRRYSGILPAYCRFLDRSLGLLLEQTGPATNVLILSDHGMGPWNTSHLFRADDPEKEFVSGGHEDAPAGVIIASGPGFRSSGASLTTLTDAEIPALGHVLDITPTLLALRGLPTGSDMDGSPIAPLFQPGFLDAHPVTHVASHDSLTGMPLGTEESLDPEEIEDRLEELRSLGYIQ